MSMQRSFSLFIALLLLPCFAARPLLLDELNNYFTLHVWSFNDLATDPKNPNEPPQYEKEFPKEDPEPNDGNNQRQNRPPQQQPRPEKSIVLKDRDIRFNNIVGQDEAVTQLRGVVEQFRDPSRLKLFGGEHKKGILLAGPPEIGRASCRERVSSPV